MIPKIRLGKTRLEIPRLFLGTGSSDFKGGCFQANVQPQEYAKILERAYRLGVNFWDTSDDYGTHSHVRLGLREIPREELILATKTHAAAGQDLLRSLNRSLLELGTSYADIFYLHSVDTLEGYHKRMKSAMQGMQEAKQSGLIRAIGLSTHNIHVLETAVDEPLLDVIFTNFNPFEVHMDAGLEWYSRCLQRGFDHGKGILVMKTAGEGRLGNRVKKCIRFNLSRPFIHGVCLGIVTEHELQEAVSVVAVAGDTSGNVPKQFGNPLRGIPQQRVNSLPWRLSRHPEG